MKSYALPVILSIALASLLGSLYFSEVAGVVPCLLCWYQRIAMYPLVPILAAGIAARDRNVVRYALPLSLIGLLIGTYHVLLTWGVIAAKAGSCGVGASCATVTWSLWGFVTIPFLSWLSFLAISVLLILYRKSTKS